MRKIKLMLFNWMFPNKIIWEIAGNIAERFYEKDDENKTTGEYDELQERMFWWIKNGLVDSI